MAGALAREAQVRWLHSSGTGGPFPTRVGAFGSACAAHTHTRARAHARARPRCTLQHTFSWHCTSTTTAHFCTCKLTCGCACHSGAGGRGGPCWPRDRVSRPPNRRCKPLRGLHGPQHKAQRRFAMELQFVDKSAAGLRPPSRSAQHASIRPRRPRMPGRSERAHASAARQRPHGGCHAAWATASAPHVNLRVKPCNPGRPGSSLWFESRTRQHRGST